MASVTPTYGQQIPRHYRGVAKQPHFALLAVVPVYGHLHNAHFETTSQMEHLHVKAEPV